MSQSECQYSDWRAVGFEDGAQGRPAHHFSTYRRRCADYGVTPDFTAYQAGRESGLADYCQESRGFREGSEGRVYAGVCPAASEARFLDGYDDGRTLYDLESALRQTNSRIREHESRIKQIELTLADMADALLATSTTREDRVRLLVETKQLAEERGTLSSELDDLRVRQQTQEVELGTARRELLTRR